jgi:hypothetical protein
MKRITAGSISVQRLLDNIALSYSLGEERAEMPQCGTISIP